MPDGPVPDVFARFAARSPDALAGWRGGVPVRHGALMARARAWAALGRRDAGRHCGRNFGHKFGRNCGRNVALYLDDSLEFAAALLGAWQAGKTVWLPADALPATCAALATRVDAFWGAFPADHAPLLPDDDDDDGAAWRAPAPDALALVVFTSGSTGAPVPIEKRMDQLNVELAALEAQFGASIGAADVIATVSHQHIYGLLFRVLWPLAAGRALYAARHEFPETLAPALAERPCVLLASPAHLKRLPDHLDWRGAAHHLRAVFSSGGMLDADAARRAGAAFGRMPIEVYGSSETGGIAWRRRDALANDAGREGDGDVDRDTADGGWTPLPGVDWRRDADGLLAVRSAQAGQAWLGNGGWVVLADRVDTLGDGRFRLCGRADRIVKIEEKRVSLDAVEAALLASGLAREARVLACAGAGEGAKQGDRAGDARQVLAAFVVPSDAGVAVLAQGGRPALNARLRAALASTVEAVALPRRWRYLDALPVNAQGKTTAAALMALLAPPPTRDDASEMTPAPAAARPRYPTVQVLERADAHALLELYVPPDLLYFDGHFEGSPVLPGVVQVDWAIHYGARMLGQAGVFAGMQALKFQQVIRPGQPVRLELTRDVVKGNLSFRYFSSAGPHASGRILFGPDSAC